MSASKQDIIDIDDDESGNATVREDLGAQLVCGEYVFLLLSLVSTCSSIANHANSITRQMLSRAIPQAPRYTRPESTRMTPLMTGE